MKKLKYVKLFENFGNEISTELISALKNASMSGFIDIAALNSILDKIDLHKGDRK